MPETRTVKGCCPLDCQDSCAWVAHLDGDRVVRMSGARDHPFTRGALCAKVNDYQERTYSPDRLLHPLHRIGPKGSGRFERVSWDEALDEVATRFRDIIAAHGAEALLPLNYLGSMGVVQRRALMRVFHALGASRFHGSICGASGNTLAAEGHPLGFDPETIADSRYILVWGANLLSTSHHHWHPITEAKRRGARTVAIDPRRTRTAAACDEHLPIRPGTDPFLAAGLARVLFTEGLADLDFAASVSQDLDTFREQVEPWTPERTAAACGLVPDDILRVGRAFGRARPGTLRAGIAPQQSVHGEAFVRGLSALAILAGHWKLPGGGLFLETSPELHERRASRPDLGRQDVRSLDMARLGEHLLSRTLEPPVMGLMVWTMNPAVDQPDVGSVRRGLARGDLFTVVVEHFLTDTARYADIVLPSTTQLEHFDVQGAWGHHYISANNPAIEPLGESRSHGEIMRMLAPRLGLDHPAFLETDHEIAASALPDGIALEQLAADGWRRNPPPRPSFGNGTRLRLAGPLPPVTDRPTPGRFQLLTPKSHYFLNSSFGNMARHRQAMVRPTLDMHPADASANTLTDGDRVRLSNEHGSIAAWLRVTEEILPGVVVLPGKWWGEPEETAAVANLLTAPRWSPGGQPAYNDTWVEVRRA